MTSKAEFSRTYILSAGEADARGLMPLTLLTKQVIEIATEHANALDIGYATLIESNFGWVLSRLSIDIDRLPCINEEYTLNTWIESFNRHFSERCFEMFDNCNRIIAHIRTTWVAIDYSSRQMADMTKLMSGGFPILDRKCPVEPCRRIVIADPDNAVADNYTFKYCDIDLNRHVNTVRYLDLILNQWGLEFHDRHNIAHFDIIFAHECYFNEQVVIRRGDDAQGMTVVEILKGDGNRAIASRIKWQARQ